MESFYSILIGGEGSYARHKSALGLAKASSNKNSKGKYTSRVHCRPSHYPADLRPKGRLSSGDPCTIQAWFALSARLDPITTNMAYWLIAKFGLREV
ncbi:hypothetical protein [Nitrosococcus wardiae]|uniref:Uncharacterized protein n=1 Tax=Nitrosococcus wardiae TaxID=1814290 RepID=A0A4P7BU34_9GAMM|nr:hypothetical protein [Nitrosococcus wardiae]QBQ53371.1 hypothetical protein E3U44_01750 [Nitrosococcus wardiae]